MRIEAPGYTIDLDPARRLVRVALRGFWDAATLQAYDRDVREAGERMIAAGCPRGEMLAFVDTRALNAQSQALIADYKGRFASPDRQPRRLATLVSSALVKRQVERIDLPHQRLFETEEDALAWLFDFPAS